MVLMVSASITAASAAEGRAVRLTVTTSGATGFTVYRIVDGFDPGREGRFNVRGLVRNTRGGTVTGYDVDFPQGASIAYHVIAWDGDGATDEATSQPVQTTRFGDCLIGGGATAARAAVVVEKITPLTFAARSETVPVLRRRDPVVVAARRQYPEFTLVCHTWTDAEYQAVEDILYRWPVITFSPEYPRWANSGTGLLVAVQDVTVDTPVMWRSTRAGVWEERTWELRCQQIAAPTATLVTTLPAGW